MITNYEWLQVCELLKNNLSVPQIARRINRSAPAIYALLKNGGPKNKIPKKEKENIPKKIIEFIGYLDRQLKSGATNYTKLFIELKTQGYVGSYNSLYRYLRATHKTTNDDYKYPHRYETGPGEQAQVDWGTLGQIEINGDFQRLYCFVYVLGYSRALYAELVLRQDSQSFQRCHINAFRELGIPKTILYDNIKTVVIYREKRPGMADVIHYNLAFLDFAKYHDFEIELCPPYWPRSKGKVEAGVKYIKNNFVQGLNLNQKFASLEDLNNQLRAWLKTVANVRVHATTGEKPIERWAREKPHLHFLDPDHHYEVSPFSSRNSTKDGMVQYRSNFYSIPAEYSRKKLSVKEINSDGIQEVEVYFEDKVIATHSLSPERGNWIIKDEHLIKDQVFPKSKNNKKKYPEVFTRPLSYYDQLIGVKNG